MDENEREERGHEHSHSHGHEHGHSHEHPHSHEHAHGHEYRHVHPPEEQKAVLDRLARAIGHLESIKRMVENDRDCSEVLIQLSAVRSAITNTGKAIILQHIEHCIVDAIQSNEMERVEDLKDAINKFLK
jgi:DNA-binding FrmR family transcriptional regulator